ncbi:hypothetical protein ABBQ32_005633 [Trebouxia sp. C0010 RCD-2024]
MDAHNAVLLEALASLSELDFPMQDILDLQLQVVLLRRKAVAQQAPKQTQPELKAISVQQGIHLDHCQTHLADALDKFNTFLLGFLVARGCEKLHKELGGPQDQQSWDDWLDCIPSETLAMLKIPPDMKNLLKVSGYAAEINSTEAAKNHTRDV